jgi:hypothetical protein
MATVIFETQSDLSTWRDKHPALADRFASIRPALDKLIQAFANFRCMVSGVLKIVTPCQKSWIPQIRQLEGFSRFLLGPSELELTAITGSDAVVIFNVGDIRDDAIVVGDVGVEETGPTTDVLHRRIDFAFSLF